MTDLHFEEMEAAFFDLAERYKSFLHQKENFNKPLSIESPDGVIMEASVSALAPHAVNHGTCHHGNARCLESLGIALMRPDCLSLPAYNSNDAFSYQNIEHNRTVHPNRVAGFICQA